jgi:hypothetical protein
MKRSGDEVDTMDRYTFEHDITEPVDGAAFSFPACHDTPPQPARPRRRRDQVPDQGPEAPMRIFRGLLWGPAISAALYAVLIFGTYAWLEA